MTDDYMTNLGSDVSSSGQESLRQCLHTLNHARVRRLYQIYFFTKSTPFLPCATRSPIIESKTSCSKPDRVPNECTSSTPLGPRVTYTYRCMYSHIMSVHVKCVKISHVHNVFTLVHKCLDWRYTYRYIHKYLRTYITTSFNTTAHSVTSQRPTHIPAWRRTGRR